MEPPGSSPSWTHPKQRWQFQNCSRHRRLNSLRFRLASDQNLRAGEKVDEQESEQRPSAEQRHKYPDIASANG